MRAADCTRRFVFLADGGVHVIWACGVALVNPDETAVDVELLADRYPFHHHRRHLGSSHA